MIANRNLHPVVSGLRMRFIPRARLGQGLVAMGPWVDLVLLLMFYVILSSQFIVQPGVVIDLPEGKVMDGARLGMTLVVLAPVAHSAGGGHVVFFNDKRFLTDRPEHIERLQREIEMRAQRLPGSGVTIQADHMVEHGIIVKLVELARESGVKSVNIATRNAR